MTLNQIGKLIAESQHTHIQKHIKNEKSKEEQTEKKNTINLIIFTGMSAL